MAYQVNLPSDTNKGRFNLYTGKYIGCENINTSRIFISYLQYDSCIILIMRCIPPITADNDAYNCSHNVNHSYSSSSLLNSEYYIFNLGILLMQLPKFVTKLGISREEIPRNRD